MLFSEMHNHGLHHTLFFALHRRTKTAFTKQFTKSSMAFTDSFCMKGNQNRQYGVRGTQGLTADKVAPSSYYLRTFGGVFGNVLHLVEW